MCFTVAVVLAFSLLLALVLARAFLLAAGRVLLSSFWLWKEMFFKLKVTLNYKKLLSIQYTIYNIIPSGRICDCKRTF